MKCPECKTESFYTPKVNTLRYYSLSHECQGCCIKLHNVRLAFNCAVHSNTFYRPLIQSAPCFI